MPRVKNLNACTGCLRCELACAFHHTGEFSRSHSSIHISKPLLNPDHPARIVFNTDTQNTRPICDFCKGEEVPFCIRFCPEPVFTSESDTP